MRCRFGSKRRLVATIEWLRLCPKPGLRPQMEQTLDIGDLVWCRATQRQGRRLCLSMREVALESATSQAARAATITSMTAAPTAAMRSHRAPRRVRRGRRAARHATRSTTSTSSRCPTATPAPTSRTARSVLTRSRRTAAASRRAIARVGARAALLGARGNSGIILSQLVRGACDRLGEGGRSTARASPTRCAGPARRPTRRCASPSRARC